VQRQKNVGYRSANAVEEYAAITEEVIANLTNQHSKDMKAHMQLMEGLAKSMTKLVQGMRGQNPTPAPAPANAGTKKCKDYRKKLANVKECTHCKCKHPNRTNDQCWELKANAATCPDGWKFQMTVCGADNSN
jgi:hypothetical protein